MFAFTSSLVNVYLSHVITFYDSYAINVFSNMAEMLITSTWKSFFVFMLFAIYIFSSWISINKQNVNFGAEKSVF